MSVRLWRSFLGAACLWPLASFAAGFYFGENGVRAFGQGGAFVAQADDLSALQHNPAGLHQLRGFHFLADGRLSNHAVTFQRRDADGSASIAQPVSNGAGLFFGPLLAASYGFDLGDRPLTLAIGVYGPPAVGRYGYPAPNYTRDSRGGYEENPIRDAPQRFALIDSNIFVAYPTLAAAYAPVRWIAVGASVQYVYSTFSLSRSISAITNTPTQMRDENPLFDNGVSVQLQGQPRLTGIVGVQVKPLDNLAFGLSFRPQIPVHAKGTIAVSLGEAAQSLGASLAGDQAELSLTLPFELKLGAHFRPLRALGLSAELVYEGWQSFNELVLTPVNVVQTVGANSRELSPVHIQTHWHGIVGGRLGGELLLPYGFSVRAGALFEPGASPSEYVNVDFTHFTRVFLTAGLGYALGPVELHGAFAFVPAGTVEVNNSQVTAENALGFPGSTVGNGTYTSGGYVGAVGIRGHFGAQSTSSRGLP